MIGLFRDELGYRYLGDWTVRDGNSNIEEKLLTDYLHNKGGYSAAQISAARRQGRTVFRAADENTLGKLVPKVSGWSNSMSQCRSGPGKGRPMR